MSLYGYIWNCGDEVCDCHQPRIAEGARLDGDFLVGGRDVWEGTFISGPGGDDYAAMRCELAAECERRGATIAFDSDRLLS